jgi:hypothetical protein
VLDAVEKLVGELGPDVEGKTRLPATTETGQGEQTDAG